MSTIPPNLFPSPSPSPSLLTRSAVQWGDRATPTQVQDVLTSLPRLGFEPSEYQVGSWGRKGVVKG